MALALPNVDAPKGRVSPSNSKEGEKAINPLNANIVAKFRKWKNYRMLESYHRMGVKPPDFLVKETKRPKSRAQKRDAPRPQSELRVSRGKSNLLKGNVKQSSSLPSTPVENNIEEGVPCGSENTVFTGWLDQSEGLVGEDSAIENVETVRDTTISASASSREDNEDLTAAESTKQNIKQDDDVGDDDDDEDDDRIIELDDNEVDRIIQIGHMLLDKREPLLEIEKLLTERSRRFSKYHKRLESLRMHHIEGFYQLIWRLPDVKSLLEKGENSENPITYSPPFMSHTQGYKLMLGLNLNGDGAGRGTHMSLFFCICQGKWDALQLWPFGHVVTFTLLDQNEHPEDRQHHSQTLATNPCKENRVFLGRPVGVRNAFIGFPKFASHEILRSRDYMKDDTIYLGVKVDTTSYNVRNRIQETQGLNEGTTV